MGLPSLAPLIGILDDADRPEARMLIVVWGHPMHPSIEYVNLLIPPLGLRGRFGHYPSRFTPLHRFGVKAEFCPDAALRVLAIGESVATYPDGKPRPWQGRPDDEIDIRHAVAGVVIKAVRAVKDGVHG